MEERGSRGRKLSISLAMYHEEDANDLSDLGIGTSSGKSSVSGDTHDDTHSVLVKIIYLSILYKIQFNFVYPLFRKDIKNAYNQYLSSCISFVSVRTFIKISVKKEFSLTKNQFSSIRKFSQLTLYNNYSYFHIKPKTRQTFSRATEIAK